MTIHEPLTLATDYMLSIACIVFGVLLWRHNVRLWAGSFLFTALASFFGGTYHGFGGEAWWKLTVYSVGIGSLLLVLGATRSVVARGIAVVAFVAYAVWMVNHDDFLYVIAEYGLSLIMVAVLQVAAWLQYRVASAAWIIGSEAIAVIAAVVQQAPIAYHNDIYHVIQFVSLWMLYRGGLLLTTRDTARLTIQPT